MLVDPLTELLINYLRFRHFVYFSLDDLNIFMHKRFVKLRKQRIGIIIKTSVRKNVGKQRF